MNGVLESEALQAGQGKGYDVAWSIQEFPKDIIWGPNSGDAINKNYDGYWAHIGEPVYGGSHIPVSQNDTGFGGGYTDSVGSRVWWSVFHV